MAGRELGIRGELDGGLLREPEPVGGAERRLDELRRRRRLRVEQQHGLRAGQPDVRDPQHGRCRRCRLGRDPAVHATERIDAGRRLGRREHVCATAAATTPPAPPSPTRPTIAYDGSDVFFQCASGLPPCSTGTYDFAGVLGIPGGRGGQPLPQRRLRRRGGLRLQRGRQRRRVVARAAVVGEPPALQRSDTGRQRRRRDAAEPERGRHRRNSRSTPPIPVAPACIS